MYLVFESQGTTFLVQVGNGVDGRTCLRGNFPVAFFSHGKNSCQDLVCTCVYYMMCNLYMMMSPRVQKRFFC